MNDKELLELAAKAGAIKGEWSRWHQSYGDLWVEGLDTGGPILWNPLTDDGDALRLAVKLNIELEFLGQGRTLALPKNLHRQIQDVVHETDKDNPYAATRRAIVRAAAEIGRGME
jgi:hypothetical protein